MQQEAINKLKQLITTESEIYMFTATNLLLFCDNLYLMYREHFIYYMN